MIERVNNTVREGRTFRWMDNDKSAQIMADGIRISYNFIRPHMGSDVLTPAQAAELDLAWTESGGRHSSRRRSRPFPSP